MRSCDRGDPERAVTVDEAAVVAGTAGSRHDLLEGERARADSDDVVAVEPCNLGVAVGDPDVAGRVRRDPARREAAADGHRLAGAGIDSCQRTNAGVHETRAARAAF